MARHPDEHELIALALGTLPGEPAELLHHLTTCPVCRSAYDELSAAVDSVLPAAPATAAPPGFDARVLDRLGLRPDPSEQRLPAAVHARQPGARSVAHRLATRLVPRRAHSGPELEARPASVTPRRPYRVPLLVAAAAAAGICLGAVGTSVLNGGPVTEQVTAGADGAVLTTGSGAAVGTVDPSYAGTAHVVVMQITSGRPGTHYTCRLLLKNGTTRDAGQWWMPPTGHATWIAYAAADTVDRVQLVTDDGRVWSSADLPG